MGNVRIDYPGGSYREIIGELNADNSEIPASGFRKLDENTFVFDGRTTVQESSAYSIRTPFFVNRRRRITRRLYYRIYDELPEVGDELSMNSTRSLSSSRNKKELNESVECSCQA